jgi:hypothetical protein
MGFPGNKMADKAAEAGSQSNRFTQMEICNSRTELKTFIRDARNLEWPNGVAPLAMPRRWRTVLKKHQAEKIP